MQVRVVRLAVVFWMTFASAAASGEIRSLTPSEVQSRLQSAQIVVFDANPTDIFRKYHVPGAKRVEYDQVSAQDLPTDKEAAIVFYCMNERCPASSIAAQRARTFGWRKVYVMPKGLQGWIAAGLPTVSGP